MPTFRPGSILDRLQRGFREERSFTQPFLSMLMGNGAPAEFKPEESLRAENDNVWLHAAVTKISSEMARVPLRLAKKNAKGELEYIDKHQALETLAKPQPIPGGKSMLTTMDLKIITAKHLLMPGEAFWVLDGKLSEKLGSAPTFIHVALPQYMSPVPDSMGVVKEYRYRLPDKEFVFDPMQVVHFKLPNTLNFFRGQSPVQSLRYALDTHFEAERLNFKRLNNNAVPSGVITTETTLTPDQSDKFKQQWKGMYAGTDNSGKVALLPKGIDFKPVQQSNQEMQFMEGLSLNRDEILANYGVGMEILGKTESQTRANADTAVYVFMRFGVLPFLEKFVDTLNNDYLPAFPGTEGLTFVFDDPVPENMEEKRLNMQALFDMGAATPNEIRKQFGLEPLDEEGMDQPYIDFNKMPVGQSPPLAA